MNDENTQARLQDRTRWLERMVGHVKPDRLVEMGCGGGFVLSFLADRFPDCLIVGVDRSPERLEDVTASKRVNVIAVQADITRRIFSAGTFNTAVFSGVLHEVCSDYGETKVTDTLTAVREILDDDGVVIIQDFLKPSPRMVEITFKDKKTHARFLRFTKEFRPRKIDFHETGWTVRLDVADAAEFLSKYKSPDEEDWEHEMRETHFCFTCDDQAALAQRAGFRVTNTERLPAAPHKLDSFREDMEFDFESDYAWLQVVLARG